VIEPFHCEYTGTCPICEATAQFRADGPWLRDTLKCQSCANGSIPRERALALVLNEAIPNWRECSIHESSPVNRGISRKLRAEAKYHVATQFYPRIGLGQMHQGFRNEDLQHLTFSDNTFDLFVSLDVFEHIPDPRLAFSEIWRTLKMGGILLSTFPVRKAQVAAVESRVIFNGDGTVTHLKEPQFHGNPISSDGSLVTVDYGYEIHKQIAAWAPFDVRIYRFNDVEHGILGEYTEVFLCRKRADDRVVAQIHAARTL
jgi:SAM-dependent methyltransferase